MIKNQWYAILPSDSIKNGHILGVKRLGLELAVFRGSDGKLGCVVDLCSHRGARLSHGRVEHNCVRCPFHGLQFDAAGQCRLVPAMGKATTMDLSRFHVQEYAVREAHGIIYLWYADDKKSAAALPFFDEYLDDSWVYSEIADHWNTHYSRAIENQLDVVHVPIVHYNTIGRGGKTLINGPKVLVEGDTIITSANNEIDNGQKPKLPDQCEINPTFLMFRFPNIWLNHISDNMMVMAYFAPVDEENTVLYIRYYTKMSSVRAINQAMAWVGKYANRIIERQDKRVVITQRPKASSYYSGEKLLVGDGPIVAYRRIRHQLKQAAENANAPEGDKSKKVPGKKSSASAKATAVAKQPAAGKATGAAKASAAGKAATTGKAAPAATAKKSTNKAAAAKPETAKNAGTDKPTAAGKATGTMKTPPASSKKEAAPVKAPPAGTPSLASADIPAEPTKAADTIPVDMDIPLDKDTN